MADTFVVVETPSVTIVLPTAGAGQTLVNTSDATSHTVSLSSFGGSVKLAEGSGVTLTTTGTATDAVVTIASTGGGGGTWGSITGTLSDQTDLQTALNAKAALSHTHPLSQITQSGATSGQIPKWNGSAWVPQDESGGAGTLQTVTDAGAITTNAITINREDTDTDPGILFDGTQQNVLKIARHPDTVTPAVTDFNIVRGLFPSASTAGDNQVVSFGFNVNSSGGLEDVAQNEMSIRLENNYAVAPGGTNYFELHLPQVTYTDADSRRPITMLLSNDVTNKTGALGLTTDHLLIADYKTFTQRVIWGLSPTGAYPEGINFLGSARLTFGINNTPILFQRNAADNAYVQILKVDSTDRIFFGGSGESNIAVYNQLQITDSGYLWNENGAIAVGKVGHRTRLDIDSGSAEIMRWSESGTLYATQRMDTDTWNVVGRTGKYVYRSNLTAPDNSFCLDASGNISLGEFGGATSRFDITTASGATTKMLRLKNSTGTADLYRSDATPEAAITGNPGDFVFSSISSAGRWWGKASGTGNTGYVEFVTSGNISSYVPTITLSGDVTGSGTTSITTAYNGTVPVTKGGTGLTALGSPLQQLRVNAGGTALEYFTPSVSGDLVNGGQSTGAIVSYGTTDAFGAAIKTNSITRLSITGAASTGGDITSAGVTANTATVQDRLIIQTESTAAGTSAGFGSGILFQGESALSASMRDMIRITAKWQSATDATRISTLSFQTVDAGNALTEIVTIGTVGATSGELTVGSANGSKLRAASLTTAQSFTVGNSSSALTLGGSSGTVTMSTSGANIAIHTTSNAGSATNSINFGNNTSFTQTSNTRNYIEFNWGFAPTSGSAIHNQLVFNGTFNQTGGASGITRGIYLNQTITAVADMRLLEIAANGSNVKGVYQTGATVTNNFVGKTTFGATTTPTALVMLAAGTATANTGPLKFNSGTLLTTPEALSVEALTDALYVTTTTGTVRRMIVAGSTGRATAQTAANASVATYTLGATDATYEVSANVLVTTSSAEAFTVTVDYTDEGNTARTATMNFQILAGTVGTGINFANGAVPYIGIPLHLRCKASTAITVKTTGTFTGATYNAEGVIKQQS